MPAVTGRRTGCCTGAVHDVLRMMGRDNVVLPPGIEATATAS
jgi:hypothetical protein